MKRWWNTPRHYASARVTRRRIGRVLMGIAMTCAVSLPIARPGPTLPRTSGAVIEAWAFGTLSGATHPNSQEACDLDHVCELAISSDGGAGTGAGTTIKTSFQTGSQGEPSPNLPFSLMETIDYSHPVTKGVRGNHGGGACYPGIGVMTIAIDPSSMLVLDIVGMACLVGSSTVQVVFTGSYVADDASTGTVANAWGVGTVNINNPSGLPGTGINMKGSLLGQLTYGS
jgi:hypothetical protein